jgi:hypothetical protein
MPLDNQKPITNDFNIKSIEAQKKIEQEIKNRTGSYNLNEQEQSNVKEIILNRENDLNAEKRDFKQNYNERVKETFRELKEKQAPELNMDLTPEGARTQLNDTELSRKAHIQTKAKFKAKMQKIEENANNKINHVLDKAKQQGRGAQIQDQQQNKSLTQEFNQNR